MSTKPGYDPAADPKARRLVQDPIIGPLVRAELAAEHPRPGYFRGLAAAETRADTAEALRRLARKLAEVNR